MLAYVGRLALTFAFKQPGQQMLHLCNRAYYKPDVLSIFAHLHFGQLSCLSGAFVNDAQVERRSSHLGTDLVRLHVGTKPYTKLLSSVQHELAVPSDDCPVNDHGGGRDILELAAEIVILQRCI